MLPFLLTLRQIARGIWRGLRDPEFQVLFSLVFLTVLSGTLFLHPVRGDALVGRTLLQCHHPDYHRIW